MITFRPLCVPDTHQYILGNFGCICRC
uniref:Uncharacterized protein n=1 Tax=Arundo donax TaxID=35708 RepID=A0A0A9AUX7_ARUDO